MLSYAKLLRSNDPIAFGYVKFATGHRHRQSAGGSCWAPVLNGALQSSNIRLKGAKAVDCLMLKRQSDIFYTWWNTIQGQ